MNLEVYTFCCLLKEYDEDFATLSFQEQYDSASKYYKQFLTSEHYKENIELIDAIDSYLVDRYSSDDFDGLEFEED